MLFSFVFFGLGAPACARLRARASTESRAAKRFPTPSVQWIWGQRVGRIFVFSLSLFLSFFGLAPQPARVCARGRPLSPGPRSGFRHLPHSGFAGGRWAVFVPSLSLSLSLSLSKHTIRIKGDEHSIVFVLFVLRFCP